MKVLVTLPLTPAQANRVRAAAGDGSVVLSDDCTEQRREIQDADVLLGRLTPELLEFAPQLRWVQQFGAGVDGSLFPEFRDSDIVLTSEKGSVGSHLADQAFALLLALTRGIARSIRERTWDNRMAIRLAAWELGDKTMGIVGLGGTGRAVAERAAGFGMRIIAVDPEEVPLPPGVDACWPMDRFPQLLDESDVVVIGAPLTAQTQGLFDRAAFQAMRRHALLINVTRGKIVDEAALMEALREGLIGGAGLDVTPEEPLPPDHPLWDLPNVIVTPHVAGGSPLRSDRAVDLFCRNLQRFQAGEPLESVIDKRKGY